MKLQSGQFLKSSNYTIEQKLDSGGFGIAYLAKNKHGNLVVIKILKDIDVNDPNFNKLRQDFLNEALRLKECIHPHIVKIHEIITEEDFLGIVMEYIEGDNLRGQVLPESEALKYIYQIGDALTVMHGNQLLHQDVKPANIIAINDLAEFGEEAKDAIPELVKFLQHNQKDYSQSAESTLEKIGLPTIPALTEILKNKDEDIKLRRSVATILKNISKNTKEVIPELIDFTVELMEYEDAEIRWYAVVTIGEIEIGLKGLHIVPFLIKKLKDERKGIRAYAAFALGRIGESAKDAIPHLLEKLGDYNESQEVFIASLEALDSIGFEIEDINIRFFSKEGIPEEVMSGKKVIINYREEQQKLRDEAKNKPGIRLEYRRPLSANTPPQLCFNPQLKSEC